MKISDFYRAAPESYHGVPATEAGPAAAVSESTPDISSGGQVPSLLIVAYGYAEAVGMLRAAVPRCPGREQGRPFRT